MGLVPEQDHLTIVDPAFENKRKQTAPGMAHFAGSGPERKTCRECVEWTGCGQSVGYYSKNGRHNGALKPRSCMRYRILMQGVGPAVPFSSPACKYFVQNELSPPLKS